MTHVVMKHKLKMFKFIDAQLNKKKNKQLYIYVCLNIFDF